jgi:hypothetical protein
MKSELRVTNLRTLHFTLTFTFLSPGRARKRSQRMEEEKGERYIYA